MKFGPDWRPYLDIEAVTQAAGQPQSQLPICLHIAHNAHLDPRRRRCTEARNAPRLDFRLSPGVEYRWDGKAQIQPETAR